MKNVPSFTLQIINNNDVLESFNQQNPLTENQKELIRFIVKETVQEALSKTNSSKDSPDHTPYTDIGLFYKI